MTIIKCSDRCVFQHDGICCLDSISSVNDHSGKGCMYRLEENPGKLSDCPRSSAVSDRLALHQALS